MKNQSANAERFVAPRLFTVDCVARQLGVGRTTVYKLIAAKRIRTVKVASATRVAATEIDRFIAEL
ncbi:MAG: hypothetical protein AMXMBFR81_19240 [Chthonomonas sp.]